MWNLGNLLTMQVLVLIHWFWIHSSKIQSDEFTSQVYSLPACFPWMCVLSRVRLFATPWTAACQAPLPTGFFRQEYWSGLPCPPPGDLPTQGLNPGLQHYRQILYQLSHHGSPRTLQWVAYPFSRGSFQARNRTGDSFIAGRFFTSWATREAPYLHWEHSNSILKTSSEV